MKLHRLQLGRYTVTIFPLTDWVFGISRQPYHTFISFGPVSVLYLNRGAK